MAIFINQNIVAIFELMINDFIRFVSIILLFSACRNSPHSQWPAQMPETDKLSDQEKIDLIIHGASTPSSAGMAATARLYENQKEWAKAMSAIQLAIEEEPMNSSFHSLKANYAYELGQINVAYREALTAYQLGSKSLKQSLDLARMAVALSEFSIVNDIIDSLLVAYPEDPDVLYMAARKHDKNNNQLLAGKYYAKARSIRPENQENAIFYSRFLVNQGNLHLAQMVLRDAIGSNSSKEAYLLQGDIYFGLQKFDTAALYYQQALAISKDTTTYNKVLATYTLLNNYDSIINTAVTAVRVYPGNKKYLLIAARYLDRKFKYDEALPYYLSLYEMDTLDTLVATELAYLQRKIAYLQRKKEEQKKLADSLGNVLPVLTF
jgi:tetratricopeptide (TPR) repeat protein